MQLNRSGFLLFTASVTGISHYGIVSCTWGSIPRDIASIVCAIIALTCGMVFTGVLGGNLFSSTLTPNGSPEMETASGWRQFMIWVIPIILIVLAYINPHALTTIDLLLGLAIIIRFIQWNGFEPTVR